MTDPLETLWGLRVQCEVGLPSGRCTEDAAVQVQVSCAADGPRQRVLCSEHARAVDPAEWDVLRVPPTVCGICGAELTVVARRRL